MSSFQKESVKINDIFKIQYFLMAQIYLVAYKCSPYFAVIVQGNFSVKKLRMRKRRYSSAQKRLILVSMNMPCIIIVGPKKFPYKCKLSWNPRSMGKVECWSSLK